MDYLRFYTHQYHVDLWRPLVNLRAMASEMNVYILDESKSTTDQQTDVAIALIDYRPEDIKVIGQPIARAPLILVPYIEQLRSLVRLELSEIPYGCKIEPILEFIRVHDAIHHTLREIKIKGSEDLNRHLEPTHSQLVRLVQAMRTPYVIDARHWREAILVMDQLPHECLRTLLLGMADMPPSYILVAEYLSECSTLEELRMPVRDENVFAWASEARRVAGLDRHHHGDLRSKSVPPSAGSKLSLSKSTSTAFSSLASLSSSSASSSSISLPSPWQLRNHYHPEWHEFEEKRATPSIVSLELCGEDRCLIPALRDAIDGFRDSLESLKAQSLAIMMTTIPVLNFMTLTWSWPLTRLAVLDLEGEVASAFDLSVLRLCPALTTLRLSLPPYMYSSSEDEKMLVEMTARMSQICLATRLLDLELQGKWPVSDELLKMIAQRMTRLTRLVLVKEVRVVDNSSISTTTTTVLLGEKRRDSCAHASSAGSKRARLPATPRRDTQGDREQFDANAGDDDVTMMIIDKHRLSAATLQQKVLLILSANF
ncbi:hypothetical protein EDD11_003268 [Mortierella claussenii]|nr:hypothetical protein EDD11_003268 [Mortierella claussenii]